MTMHLRSTVVLTRIGASLLALLGLARGLGGLLLIIQGRAALPASSSNDATMRGIGVGLVFVALLAIAAAVRLFRLLQSGLPLTGVALLAFLAGGLLNGSLLFGRPTDAGTIVNVLASVVIAAFVFLGRGALRAQPTAG